jgi:hypothetical protein
MGIEIWEILLVWLTIGVVIGGWISVDTFRRKVKGAKWVAAGIFLSVIGLALYLVVRKKQKGVKQPELQEVPQYRHSEPAPQDSQPAPVVPVSGESGPIVIPAEPERKPQTPPEAAPSAAPGEVRPEHRWAPVIREQVEGIPRCPKCDSAVSYRDDFCSECGAKIK